MDWTWRQLAHYLGPVKLQVEFQGITEEGLAKSLHQKALTRLAWVETVIFNEEVSDKEKVEILQEWFLSDTL